MEKEIRMEIKDRTAVERELNLLMEITLRMESDLLSTLNGYNEE